MDPRVSGVSYGSLFRMWGLTMKFIEGINYCLVVTPDNLKAFATKEQAVKYIESIGFHTWDFEYSWLERYQ